FATGYQAPVLKLLTSIRIDDNLLEGKSYYLAEVDTMASLIKEVSAPSQNLFLLDEVFKGTNTIERIASAKAILSYLNKHANIVIVSTHDIELSEFLSKEYELYHFEETIINDHLNFDHLLKRGPLKTRNAIKILELSDYPLEIIEEATELTKTLMSVNVT
ncbi:MAG: MutS-related protein, partial [Segetibacter sp.]